MVMPPCLLQNYVFSRLLCSMEKTCGVFFPTYLSVQLTALEAKLKTLIGLQQYTEICSLHCSMENTLLEIKVDVQIRQC